MEKPKILVILGPTASGKSDLAVKLAKKFNGEVISADSRQVYKGLNIGTGKITKKEMMGVSHHLLDVEDPKKTFTVARFKELAEEKIEEILNRGKLPIICGGTGFYIQAIVDNISLPEVLPNKKLRENLSSKSKNELFEILKKLDPERAKNIDNQNPHRLIRAIEIAKSLGRVPEIKNIESKYEFLQIGIETQDEILKEKIERRLIARIKKGMLAEAKKLHEKGLAWKRMEELGLEYKYLALFLQKKLPKEEMINQLSYAIWHYAKRQKTWFKRDSRIKWFKNTQISKMEKEIRSFKFN
jgi:tRNA dimethylallyltransferase